MNIKTKKILLYSLSSLAVIFLTAFVIYISQVSVAGLYQISSSNPECEFKVTAQGVFGKQVILLSERGQLFLEGYYKNLEIIPTKNNSKDLIYFNLENFENHQIIVLKPYPDKKLIINSKSQLSKNFLKISVYIIKYELKKDFVFELLLGFIVSTVIFILFLIIKKTKKRNYLSGKNFWYDKILVFVVGLIFWTLVILVLVEIFLRIFGAIYSSDTQVKRRQKSGDDIVILCIGDSFTYGIGATKGNDYPSQLQRILQSQTNKNVIVYNRGRCAQNSFQVLSNLQKDIDQTNPDIAVLLFGMANSWNYLGFNPQQDHIEKIKIVKLYRRIVQNIKYKNLSSDTDENVLKYANSFIEKASYYPILGKNSYLLYYYIGRYFLSLRNWHKSINYLSFALNKNPYEGKVFYALKTAILELDMEIFFKEYNQVYENTIVDQTIDLLEKLEKQFNNPVFSYLKYDYLLSKTNDEQFRKLRAQSAYLILQNDYSPLYQIALEDFFNNDFTEVNNFLLQNYKEENSEINLARIWLMLKNLKFDELNALKDNSTQKSDTNNLFATAFLINDILSQNELNTLREELKNYGIDNLSEINSKNFDLEFLNEIFENELQVYYKDYHYFLPHVLKRSANYRDTEIFSWIESDIRSSIDLCHKNGLKIICMNYPLTPPPNSEEIHYWANNVGKIWKSIAKEKNLVFVDNDSIFKNLGEKQSEYFEPRKTGSEHCNNKGYELMARNIAEKIFIFF
ncbi:MAG: SGNH/GDSL hydrolase family protein [Bacteroidales bacterium]